MGRRSPRRFLWIYLCIPSDSWLVLIDVEFPVLAGLEYMEEISKFWLHPQPFHHKCGLLFLLLTSFSSASQLPPTQSARSSTSDTTIILPDLPLVFQTLLKGKSYAGRYFGEPCQGDLEGESGNADNTDPTCGPAAGTSSTSQWNDCTV